jgi:hypothetical protein
MSGIVLISSWTAVRRGWESWDDFQVYGTLISIALCMTVLILATYRMLKKPTELCLSSDRIHVNGRTLSPKDIRVIMIMGDYRTSVGILPHEKKIVPVNLAFAFAKEEDEGIADLGRWAKENRVKIEYRNFLAWI